MFTMRRLFNFILLVVGLVIFLVLSLYVIDTIEVILGSDSSIKIQNAIFFVTFLFALLFVTLLRSLYRIVRDSKSKYRKSV